MLKVRHCPRFRQEPVVLDRLKLCGLDVLDSHEAFRIPVERLPNLAHAAGAERTVDFVPIVEQLCRLPGCILRLLNEPAGDRDRAVDIRVVQIRLGCVGHIGIRLVR